ncbi:MAG: Arm DNA-binding domain-containing protein, partial [Pseudomonadota bacterium]|nr:Arm DNA-binding domain-containing protein [Pseudomonadota bacterium]
MDRSVQLTTDRQILALRPTKTIYEKKITGSRGLSIRVLPSSTKQFEFRYTSRQGARRRLALGIYPDLSLAEARLKAAGVRVAVADGHDPVAERQAARAKALKIETLDSLAEGYWAAAEV